MGDLINAAYIFIDMQISDMKQYKEYMVVVPATTAAVGGEYLVRGGKFETLESNWKFARIAMLLSPQL
jgi:uncharacterized protein (DUF1330 family)